MAKVIYECPVCRGVADHAKNCGTPGCSREGKPLIKRIEGKKHKR